MAINFCLRRASYSIIPPAVTPGQSLPFARFSTSTATNNNNNLSSLLASSEPAPDALTNPARNPFQLLYSNDEKVVFHRKVGHETNRLEVYGATGGDDDIPNVLMNVSISRKCQQMNFLVTAEPKRINIHRLDMSDHPSNGHLRAFEGYLGKKGINGTTVGILLNFFKKQPKE